MNGYSISDVAERTGFPASTLRFYEQSGLVRPARTPAGYRSYDDTHVEALAFIGRAKRFGLSLDEITDLLSLLDDDRCAPVQGRLRELIELKIGEARTTIAELTAFTAELRQVASTLEGHTPDGPCDDACGCTTDAAPVTLSRPQSAQRERPPVACTLAPDRMGDRVAEWQAVVGRATRREAVETGVRVHFPADTDVSELARLAVAEQGCCSFLSFAISIDPSGITLEVSAPDDARPIVNSLIGLSA